MLSYRQDSAEKKHPSLEIFPMADDFLNLWPGPWKPLINPKISANNNKKKDAAFLSCFSVFLFLSNIAWLYHCNNPGVWELMGKLQGEGGWCPDLQKYQPQPQRQWAAFVGICLHLAFQKKTRAGGASWCSCPFSALEGSQTFSGAEELHSPLAAAVKSLQPHPAFLFVAWQHKEALGKPKHEHN